MKHPDPSKLGAALAAHDHDLEVMKTIAADLSFQRERAEQREADGRRTLERFGIVNRSTARRAGLRNPKKPRTMKVPK